MLGSETPAVARSHAEGQVVSTVCGWRHTQSSLPLSLPYLSRLVISFIHPSRGDRTVTLWAKLRLSCWAATCKTGLPADTWRSAELPGSLIMNILVAGSTSMDVSLFLYLK